MTSPVALVLGLIVSAPALWGALVTGDVAVETALIRLLVALVVAGVGWAALSRLWAGYGAHAVQIPGAEPQVDANAAGLPASAARGQQPHGRRKDDVQPA